MEMDFWELIVPVGISTIRGKLLVFVVTITTMSNIELLSVIAV